MQHDLAHARDSIGQRARRWVARARGLTTDAAMQAHAQRPRPRGIVLGGDLDDVVERDSVVPRLQLDAAGPLGSVRATRLELRPYLVEACAGGEDLLQGLLGGALVIGIPERPHGDIESGGRGRRLSCYRGRDAREERGTKHVCSSHGGNILRRSTPRVRPRGLAIHSGARRGGLPFKTVV